MPSDLLALTIQSEDGALLPIKKGDVDLTTKANYTAMREQFCRLMAQGDLDEIEAYCQAFGKELVLTDSGRVANGNKLNRIIISASTRLMKDPNILLRVQQLKEPVAKKNLKKLEYTLQRAFEQCEEAYQLARATLDPKTMVKCIELQGQFGKLIHQTIDVNHRFGVLDEADTAVLLEMKKKLELQMRKQRKQLNAPVVDAEVVEPVTVEGGA